MAKAGQMSIKYPAFAMASTPRSALAWPNSLFYPGFTLISCEPSSSFRPKLPLRYTKLLPRLLAIPWMSAN
jgi:hypothetical protein